MDALAGHAHGRVFEAPYVDEEVDDGEGEVVEEGHKFADDPSQLDIDNSAGPAGAPVKVGALHRRWRAHWAIAQPELLSSLRCSAQESMLWLKGRP